MYNSPSQPLRRGEDGKGEFKLLSISFSIYLFSKSPPSGD
jgi:hypothetical protein